MTELGLLTTFPSLSGGLSIGGLSFHRVSVHQHDSHGRIPLLGGWRASLRAWRRYGSLRSIDQPARSQPIGGRMTDTSKPTVLPVKPVAGLVIHFCKAMFRANFYRSV